MTDHWRGAADQVARDLARVKEERDRLRVELDKVAKAIGREDCSPASVFDRLAYLVEQESENADLRTRLDVLQAAALDLHSQLDEARTAIRVLTGVPRPGDVPGSGPTLPPPTGEVP